LVFKNKKVLPDAGLFCFTSVSDISTPKFKPALHLKFRAIAIFLLLTGLLYSGRAQAQAAQDEFGKNRIQYRQFTWKYLSSQSVDLHYYDEGDALAKAAIEIAELEFKRISELFGFTPYSKVKVFLYISSSDRLMSNVGLGEGEMFTGGKTNFTKSISEVAYEGSLTKLKKQIAAGIAQIMIRDMLFGGSFKEAVQNIYLLNLPDWFIGGAIQYAAEGWSPDLDDFMREYNNIKKIRQPANYVDKEAFMIGHSIWNYMAERFGKSSVGNILNLTRIIRNEENAISGTLGMPFSAFIRDWKSFYLNHYRINQNFYNEPPKSQKISSNFSQKTYQQICISPSGDYLAYSRHWKGKFQVLAMDLKTRRSHVIFRGGSKVKHQNAEGEFPIITFNPLNEILLAFPDKGKWEGKVISVTGKTVRRVDFFSGFNEIYSLAVSPNGKKLVFSASRNGFSDIYLAEAKSGKIRRLTRDFYDDLDPVFSVSGDSVLFASNRPRKDSTSGEKNLPDLKRKMALFSLSTAEDTKPELFLAGSGNLVQPRRSQDGRLYCLSDESGTNNLALVQKDKGTRAALLLTTCKYALKAFDIHPEKQIIAYSCTVRLKPGFFLDPKFEAAPLFIPQNLQALSRDSGSDKSTVLPALKPKWLQDSGRIDIRNYVFEDEKIGETQTGLPQNNRTGRKKSERVKLKKETKPFAIDLQGPFDYKPRVTANYITTGLMVSPIPSWGLGGLVDFSMHDLFENHRFNGGMNIFFSDMEMRNNQAFLEYQYLKKRLDFKLRADRISIQNTSFTQSIRQRDILTGFSATLSYPISNALRLDFSPYFQNTQRVIFNNNGFAPGLGGPDQFVYYYGLLGQMVFDNTTRLGMNMISGTRFKIRAQYQLANQFARKEFGEFFADLRTYQPLHKEIILAFRGTFGTFFGPGAKQYMVGGMDNWLFRGYEVSNEKDDPLKGLNQNNQIISSDEAQTNWLFNRYVTNLRGFRYNNIYGRSYLLFNAELRVPIIRYFYKGPINSNFWRNLQLTAFSDAGTAWTGVGPWSAENSLNTKVLNQGNFSVKVKSFENPFLIGYGFGSRTMVLGYYLKFDMAWGRQNGFTSSPKYYFTLGYDF
jgi:WD40 repeat protein